MNMPVDAPTLTPCDRPAYTGPRRLDDDVFQTAEEAVLAEGQGSAAMLPPPGPAAVHVREGGRRGLPLSHAFRTHVAAHPCRSTLLAAAAGALAMLVLRSQLRGHWQLPRRPRLR